MPNTLAHFGIQGVATRTLIRRADLKWILLGTIVPDIPWIVRRVVVIAIPSVDPVDLRIYAIVQSSLFFCLMLSGALALFSRRPGLVFTIVGLNSVLHLLIDACQTKWGNGVILFAPFNWGVFNFGFFWPESLPTYLLTLAGLAFILIVLVKSNEGEPVGLVRPSMSKLISAILLLSFYCLLPFAFMDAVESKDAHSVATIKNPCKNCPVEFDRVYFRKDADQNKLEAWSGSIYHIDGKQLDHSATVSIRGIFLNQSTIRVDELYEHNGFNRDYPSYLGLIFILYFWMRSLILYVKRQLMERSI